MIKYSIVKGKDSLDRRPKMYMRREKDGIVTYHRFKKKVNRWSRKYGPYGVVKSEAGELITFKVFEAVDITVHSVTTIIIETNDVTDYSQVMKQP